MISLSSYSNIGKDQDIGKQLASMRSYLNILKEEIEGELNNIGYENLDGELQAKFQDLDDSYFQIKQEVSTGEAAGKFITAEQVASLYATKASLYALSQQLDNLIAIAVTTNNLASKNIAASQLTGTIDNARINLESLIGSVTGTSHHIKWVSDGNGEYILKGYD